MLIVKNLKLFFKNKKIFRYIISGVTASATNFVTLFILVQWFKTWYLSAAVVSFCCGIIVSYFLHKFFTFENYSTNKIINQFSKFFLYNMFMLGLNTFLMYIFVDIFGFWYLLAQIIITILIAFINYIFFNKILFKNDLIF